MFEKRRLAKLLMVFAVCAQSIYPVSPAKAAESTIFTTMSSTCSPGFTIRSNVRYGYKFYAPGAVTVNAIDFKFSDASQGSGTSAIIYADSSNTMSTVIATLPWSSYNASSKIARFTGTANIPAAGNYWLEIYQNGGNIDPCYTTSVTSTGSLPGWLTYNQLAGAPTGSGFAYTGWWVMAMYSTVVDPRSIATPTVSSVVNKGANSQISVTVNTVGKVRFLANGKRIPRCTSITPTGSAPTLTATCNWIPSVQGSTRITAQLIVDSSTSVSSLPQSVNVRKRSSLR